MELICRSSELIFPKIDIRRVLIIQIFAVKVIIFLLLLMCHSCYTLVYLFSS